MLDNSVVIDNVLSVYFFVVILCIYCYFLGCLPAVLCGGFFVYCVVGLLLCLLFRCLGFVTYIGYVDLLFIIDLIVLCVLGLVEC